MEEKILKHRLNSGGLDSPNVVDREITVYGDQMWARASLASSS